MESGETNIQAYTDVVMNKALLDWEMQCLQTKIKCKNEENAKLENQITERKNNLDKLKKSAKSTCEREEKVKNNINMLRNSRAITEGLLMSTKHQLLVHEQKRNETKNVRDQILKKYSAVFESYSKIYSSLPWIQKTIELRTSVERSKIELNILKLEYSSFNKKMVLFHKIGSQRVVVAIIKLAKNLVARNNLQKEINSLFDLQKELELRISQLKEEKTKLQEKIELKVKEAVAEAKERVVKAQIDGNTGENLLNKGVVATSNLVIPMMSNQKISNESIFSRLGLFAPPSLKRPSAIQQKILEKAPRMEKGPRVTAFQVPDNIPVSDKVPAPEMVPTETNDMKLKEHIPVILEPVHEPVIIHDNNQSKIPKDQDKDRNENQEHQIIPKTAEKKKKKPKKKINHNLQQETRISVDFKEKEEGKTLIVEEDEVTVSKVSDEKKSLKKSINDEIMTKGTLNPEQVIEASSIVLPQTNPDNCTHGKISGEKQTIDPVKSIEEIQHSLMMNDPDMNNSNLSILDNISVVSSTIAQDTRKQMHSSPDFLTQTPHGYLFSPLYSPSKTDTLSEVSSIKGSKSPTYDLQNSSAVTPLFGKELEKAPGESSSDFSFFGSNTSKNIEKPAKNFFQLFG